MGILHTYEAAIIWTGAAGVGTTSYTSYSRDHDVLLEGKPPLPGSSDPGFRGDPSRYCPEELMVAALAQCHMLWVLHLAASDGVVVVGYSDRATGRMRVEAAGHGQFTEVVLRPCVTIAHAQRADGRPITDDDLAALHSRAREHCFIARSVNFAVRHDPHPPRGVVGVADHYDAVARGQVQDPKHVALRQRRHHELLGAVPARVTPEPRVRGPRQRRLALEQHVMVSAVGLSLI